MGIAPFFVLDLGLDIVDCIGQLDLMDRSFQGLYEDLDSALHLDVIVGEDVIILEQLAGADETLLVRRDVLVVLDVGLDIIDHVRRVDHKMITVSHELIDEDLHADRARDGALTS